MIVVENGSGLANADSYLSVASADAYHIKYGNVGWTGSTTLKEAALRRATRYLDDKYRFQWLGRAATSLQLRSWPRWNVTDSEGYVVASNSVPQAVKDATAELALRSLTEQILPDSEPVSQTLAESVTVGPLSVSTQVSGKRTELKRYRIVEQLIKALISGGDECVRA